MLAEIFARNVMELNLQPELIREINSLSFQMKSTTHETIENCLRMHFCMPVPEHWRKDSWITSPVVMEYGGFS